MLDVASGESTPLLNNWGGLQFSSPNDVAVHGPSGTVFMTDPAYGHAQGFRPQPQVSELAAAAAGRGRCRGVGSAEAKASGSHAAAAQQHRHPEGIPAPNSPTS